MNGISFHPSPYGRGAGGEGFARRHTPHPHGDNTVHLLPIWEKVYFSVL